MMAWDAGPPSSISPIFEQAPLQAYRGNPNRFRLAWGPIYYRGRFDGTAKVLVIGQDPAADEHVARRWWAGTSPRGSCVCRTLIPTAASTGRLTLVAIQPNAASLAEPGVGS
jgi:predicted Abi (CAAX) family protease